MGSNSFGRLFRITTWGESHGASIGVIIDGCPSGILVQKERIQKALDERRPGSRLFTSPRNESDQVEILSGVMNGVSTGTPICLTIKNRDANPSEYTPIKDILRPSHGNYTYLEKYGMFDYRGGGRASARETACRVAAGAIAQEILRAEGIEIHAYLKSVGSIAWENEASTPLEKFLMKSELFCPEASFEARVMEYLTHIQESGDSIGGVVGVQTSRLPTGLGEPIYDKLEARLAQAMLSIPACKGFDVGSGFEGTRMLGSVHNDPFILEKEQIVTKTNHSGGIQAGISNGMPLHFQAAFKPASSIKKTQDSLSLSLEKVEFKIPARGRHDPCVAIRATPVVKAMTALVLADFILLQRATKNRLARCAAPITRKQHPKTPPLSSKDQTF